MCYVGWLVGFFIFEFLSFRCGCGTWFIMEVVQKISVDAMGMLVDRVYVSGGVFNLIWAAGRYDVSAVEVGCMT